MKQLAKVLRKIDKHPRACNAPDESRMLLPDGGGAPGLSSAQNDDNFFWTHFLTSVKTANRICTGEKRHNSGGDCTKLYKFGEQRSLAPVHRVAAKNGGLPLVNRGNANLSLPPQDLRRRLTGRFRHEKPARVQAFCGNRTEIGRNAKTLLTPNPWAGGKR